MGEQLRAAREARQMTVQDVAEATNMRADHIQALERGDYKPFPAPVYIRGSVRTCARLLKLDVSAVMNALSAELGHQDESLEPGTGPRKGLVEILAYQAARFGWKRGLILLAALAIALLFWLVPVWIEKARSRDPLGELTPPTYHPPRGGEGGYLPLPQGTNQ